MKKLTLFLILPLMIMASVANASEREKLNGLKPVMKDKITVLLASARKQFPEYNIVLAETYRSQARHNDLYKKGRHVTAVKFSKHTQGLAADIYFTNGKRILEYNEAPYLKLGELGEYLGLTWGGRWKSPFDPGHFQLD